MKDIETKLQTLIACIGEKKLKQLGLLTCKGCNRIFAEMDNIISTEYLNSIEEYSVDLDDTTSEQENDVSSPAPISSEELNPEESVYHTLHAGYIYNNVQPLPTHEIMCPECGRLFILDEKNRIIPLAASLTPSENEIIKGVYVDIVL